MFGDMDTDIQTRIPDRPPRPVPNKISDMPEIPWLASEYVPRAEDRPSIRTMISRIVRTGIPILGTILLIAALGYGAVQLFSFYS